MPRFARLLPLLLLALHGHAALAGDIAPNGKMESTPRPASRAAPPSQTDTEAALGRMLEMARGQALKDPQALVEWLDTVCEPRFMTAMATVALDPKTYPKALDKMVDPATAHSWAEFTDPLLYLRWVLSAGNPEFQRAILGRPGETSPLRPGRGDAGKNVQPAAGRDWWRLPGGKHGDTAASRYY